MSTEKKVNADKTIIIDECIISLDPDETIEADKYYPPIDFYAPGCAGVKNPGSSGHGYGGILRNLTDNMTWEEYINTFGGLDGNIWIGNEYGAPWDESSNEKRLYCGSCGSICTDLLPNTYGDLDESTAQSPDDIIIIGKTYYSNEA